MLLSTNAFKDLAYSSINWRGHIGFDFETNGLSVYKGARAFIMGFTSPTGERYCVRFGDSEILKPLRILFSNPNLKYCPHNGKFELSFLLDQFGIELPSVWDTEVYARIQQNNHMKYSLQACAERIGLTKYAPMIEWLKVNKRKGLLHHHAPDELVEPYVEQDAWLSWELARQQMETFRHWDMSSPIPIRPVVELEYRTTPHLFTMEYHGLLIDVNYCQRALEHEQKKAKKAAEEFERVAGVPFVDSRKTLAPLFGRLQLQYGTTEKGNASFTEENLHACKEHAAVRALLAYRAAKKRMSSYWENFLELEHNGIIHPSINQNKAETGRMSISDPSCQNWPTDEDDPEFPIRRAFVAREDCLIASLDYSQMELRLICDEAEDMGMIRAIQTGRDFHQETADQAGVPRSLAKNGRFAKLYGAGVAKVAATLGVRESLAQSICEAIDRSSPKVAEYSADLIQYARTAPFCYNFLGRRFYFDPGFSYKYPNYKIQGGCGEILRVAICDVGDFLKAHASPETFMLIPIHDEILLNIHKRDIHLIPEIKRLMIAAHRSKKHLEMDVSVHAGPNFFDLEKVSV